MKKIEERKPVALIEEKSLMDGRMPTWEETKRLLDFLGLVYDPVTRCFYSVPDFVTAARLAQ